MNTNKQLFLNKFDKTFSYGHRHDRAYAMILIDKMLECYDLTLDDTTDIIKMVTSGDYISFYRLIESYPITEKITTADLHGGSAIKSNIIPVKIKLIHENAKAPFRAHDTDGGWDITAARIERVENTVTVYTGMCVQVPTGYKLTIVPRSNITKHNWEISNSPALIDSAYRGEIILKFKTYVAPIQVMELEDDPNKEPEMITVPQPVVNGTVDAVNIQREIQPQRQKLTYQYEPFPYKEGDRVAQCYLEEVIPMVFKTVDELDDTDRGDGGFGSTGVE